MFHSLTNMMSFVTIIVTMTNKEQQANLLKAKIAVALQSELGRVPKQEEIEQVCLLTRVLYFKRRGQKQSGQLPIF
jgi:hypothetical protein